MKGGKKKRMSGTGSPGKKQKKSQKKVSRQVSTNYPLVGILFVTIGLSLLFAYTSASYSYTNAYGQSDTDEH